MVIRTRSTKTQTLAQALIFLALVGVPASMLAQGATDPPARRNWGYVFAGVHMQDQYANILYPEPHPFKVHSAFEFSQAGLGWEWRIFKSLAVGVEGSGRSGSGGRVDSSFNLSYHFENLPKVGRTVVPFATFGGTVDWGFGDGFGIDEARYNLGTGVSLWLHRRIGPRFEIRKYGHHEGEYPGISVFELRAGVTFR